MDSKTGTPMLEALRSVAPGMPLREALEMIIAGKTGGLIAIGDESAVAAVCNGGFHVDTEFTPQRLFELAKMDGAIAVDGECQTILRANVHLVPDSKLHTSETGMRHRAAERTSRQTKALVISISQRRDVVSLYLAGDKIVLQNVEVLLAKADQALQTLQRYRSGLDEALTRLSGLEFDDMATADDVAEAVRRFEMVLRVYGEVSRYITELGIEGRLVSMQADELTLGVEEEYGLLLRDYAEDAAPRRIASLRTRLGELPWDKLLETEAMNAMLGAGVDTADQHVRPRGYRSLRRIPMLPGTVISRLVDRFGTLLAVMRASAEQLDDVDGVGARRARAILDGLERLRRGRAI